MAIFGKLELEKIIQVNDKTRLDARKSFVSVDEAAITLIEIEPVAGNGYIDVTSKQYLDWQYSADGDAVVSLRITTDGAPDTISGTLPVISELDDKLFSDDSELLPYEPQVLEWVRSGRNSFKDIHRASQDRILKYLDKNKFWDLNGDPLTKAAIIDLNEVNDWSKFMTLKLIFEGLSNATDDIFHEKSLRYRDLERTARDRAVLRVDTNGDGDNTDATDLEEFRVIDFRKE